MSYLTHAALTLRGLWEVGGQNTKAELAKVDAALQMVLEDRVGEGGLEERGQMPEHDGIQRSGPGTSKY